MSMISGLIDELNKSADEWNSSNMFELARMCREAADTIWQLRDDLQQASAENAKLRELVRNVMPIVCDGCHERLCEMPKEEHPFVTCSFADRMRELGIEVDDA